MGINENSKRQLIKAVDEVPELSGAGIGFVGMGQCTVLRESAHSSGLSTYVMVAEDQNAVDSAAGSPVPGQVNTLAPRQADPVPANANWGGELMKAGKDCGGVVLDAVVAGGAVLAEPVSAGFSTLPLIIASSALVASSLKCGLSTGRLVNLWASRADANRILDNSGWYEVTGNLIEGIELADAARSGMEVTKKYIALRNATRTPMVQLLKAANRSERKAIAQEWARFTGEAPSRRTFIRMVRQGRIPKMFTQKQVRTELLKGFVNALLAGKTGIESFRSEQGGEKAGLSRRIVVKIIQESWQSEGRPKQSNVRR